MLESSNYGLSTLIAKNRLISENFEISCVVLKGAGAEGEIQLEILDRIVSCLTQKRIHVNLLPGSFSLNGNYLARFEEIARECILAIIMPDISLTDVLYEYGYLKGGNKYVIALRDKNYSNGGIARPSSEKSRINKA